MPHVVWQVNVKMKRKQNGRFLTMKTLLNFIEELHDETRLNKSQV